MQDDREKGAENLLTVLAHDVETRAVLGELRLYGGQSARTKQQTSAPVQGTDVLSHCDGRFYSNVYKLHQTLVTLPVTTASAERTFSSTRLLKNYLGSTMSEERIVGLALMYAYRNLDIIVSEVIDRFAKLPRWVNFLL
ncbi:hypothetical protein HPB50_001486 [Hyalomma asiaticum]|uniref:Uncharacterized protein n=1 Tax=Hyalomma asiaticum TaxID=266040 RepID=A0ACB7TDE9_HYAAI|nr:hypothetical protein HPB50_001486 [Hyalomma asiaticum]